MNFDPVPPADFVLHRNQLEEEAIQILSKKEKQRRKKCLSHTIRELWNCIPGVLIHCSIYFIFIHFVIKFW